MKDCIVKMKGHDLFLDSDDCLCFDQKSAQCLTEDEAFTKIRIIASRNGSTWSTELTVCNIVIVYKKVEKPEVR